MTQGATNQALMALILRCGPQQPWQMCRHRSLDEPGGGEKEDQDRHRPAAARVAKPADDQVYDCTRERLTRDEGGARPALGQPNVLSTRTSCLLLNTTKSCQVPLAAPTSLWRSLCDLILWPLRCFRITTRVGVVLAFPRVLNHGQFTRLLTRGRSEPCCNPHLGL